MFKNCSKNVEHEVVSAVVATAVGIIVVPTAVVDGNSHLGRIAVIQAISATVVFVSPEVLGIVHVWVVVEAIPVLGRVGLPPRAAVGLLGRGRVGLGPAACQRCCATCGKEDPADHRFPPSNGFAAGPIDGPCG